MLVPLPTFYNVSRLLTYPIRLYSQPAIKSALYKLRKMTGFPFSLCKEALTKNQNQIEKAQAWLKDEAVQRGWSKAYKYANRTMSSGLLGLLMTQTRAVIVEANCETDFVARTSAFQDLVALAAETTLKNYAHFESLTNWDGSDLGNMVACNSEIMKDLLATTIGSVGENMDLRRAFGLCIPDESSFSRLAFYTHMSSDFEHRVRDVRFGKYISVIRYAPLVTKTSSAEWHEIANRLAVQVCQHIVGMNPNPSLKPPNASASNPDDEKYLLWQPFLLDETIRVGELLQQNDMILEEFIRVECGEQEVLDNSENLI